MTKKIFYSIFAACSAVFAASLLLTFFALYNYFTRVEEDRLAADTVMVEQVLEHSTGDPDWITNLDPDGFRVTLISPDGTVISDSVADPATMGNHADREEVREALETGKGESIRTSDTLTERFLYSARRLPNGDVLRVSVSNYSVFALLMGIMPPLLLIFLAAMILSLVLAVWISKRIVSPLNNLDLDHPNTEPVYEELQPLMLRLAQQKRQIRHQRQELEMRKEEFDVVTDGITEGLVLLSAKNEILSMNRAARSILKVRGSATGRPFDQVCKNPEITRLIEESQETNGMLSAVFNQDYESYMAEVSPVIQDKQREGAVLLIMNVTRQQNAEQMRREFTGNVSHELKTPLQTISGYSELLSEGFVDPENVPAFSKKILSESKRMISLIDDIIHLSYLDESDTTAMEPIDLYQSAKSVMNELSYQAQQEGVSLKLTGGTAFIKGNKQMVHSVVFNLIDNAIKYNRKDGSVTIDVKEENGNVILSVTDTGVGIPEDQLDRIFERFYRVDKSHSREIGGTGLGLSIVKHAIRIHKATIQVESEQGVGSKFTVTFPAARNAERS